MSNHKHMRIILRFEPLVLCPAFIAMNNFHYARSHKITHVTSSLKNSWTRKFLTRCRNTYNTSPQVFFESAIPRYKFPQELLDSQVPHSMSKHLRYKPASFLRIRNFNHLKYKIETFGDQLLDHK